MDKVREIDLEKRKIELAFIPSLRRTFNHMAADAKSLYLATRYIPAKSLALNYRPEFLTIIRQAQRETIAKFGFSIRQQGEAKGYCFKTAKFKALINYQIETKDVDVILEPSAEDKVNQEFALAAALFVANSTEEQADYITDTNEKEIEDAQKMAVILFFQTESKLTSKIDKLTEQLRNAEYQQMLDGSTSIAKAKTEKIKKEIAETNKELQILRNGKDDFIANKIEDKIVKDGVNRSELIASQNVGMAESWARNEEAELVHEAIPTITIKKKWQAIIDSRTRLTHSIADGQTVGLNEKFIVGGYKADYPRDSSLPIEETANCRCVALHSWA